MIIYSYKYFKSDFTNQSGKNKEGGKSQNNSKNEEQWGREDLR